MQRLKVVVGVFVLLVLGAVTASSASASPTSNSTSITLVCDKHVASVAKLTLQRSSDDAASLADVTIECGVDTSVGATRNKVSIPTGLISATYVTVTSWTVTSATGGCAAAAPITYKATCPQGGGVGAELIVR